MDNHFFLSEGEATHSRTQAPGLPFTLLRQTRKVYDVLAPLYPVSSLLFHSRAHGQALAASGITNGMRVLEVAIGSGEMFHQLVDINPDGQTLGIDLSPNMAAKTQAGVRRKYSGSATYCQAANACHMPFATGSFDALVCCYLLELLSDEDIEGTLAEFQRILKVGGRLTLILICQRESTFNALYRICTKVAPAFWGRQVERRVPKLLESLRFQARKRPHRSTDLLPVARRDSFEPDGSSVGGDRTSARVPA